MHLSSFEPINEPVTFACNCEVCGKPSKRYALRTKRHRGNITTELKVCSRCAIELVNVISLGLRK